jgi:ATP-binding cassette subfamily F protein uup
MLVLDEPTNDLDVETLELLEEVLAGFDGTVLLVSHDRAFLDNVVTSSLVFEGHGKVREYVGGYADWLRQGGKVESLAEWDSGAMAPDTPDVPAPVASKPEVATPASAPAPAQTPAQPKVKLTYKLQRELDGLPAQMEKLEHELAKWQAQVNDASFYQQSVEKTTEVLDKMAAKQVELDKAMERWAELEDTQG